MKRHVIYPNPPSPLPTHTHNTFSHTHLKHMYAHTAQIYITTFPSPLLINVGETLSMNCFYGTTDTFRKWIHPSLGMITQSIGHLTLKVLRGTRVATLVVHSATPDRDYGTYTCIVRTSAGVILSENVQAQFYDGMQIITPSHQSFTVLEGGSVSLPCVAKHAAKIEWRKVPISTELRNTSDGHVVILPDWLVINNARFSDNGSYECTVTANNTSNNNSIIAHLLVHGKVTTLIMFVVEMCQDLTFFEPNVHYSMWTMIISNTSLTHYKYTVLYALGSYTQG